MDVELGAGQRVSLRAVDPALLGAGARVDALTGLQRLRSWVDAQEQVLLAAMAGPGDAPVAAPVGSAASDKQYVREQIACALRISPLTVNARLHVARELVGRLPDTLALLDAGAITMRAARLLAETVGPLPDVAAAEVQRRVLGRAPQQTFANFRACVQRAVLAVDPRTAEAKHEAARAGRRVEYRVLEDGMGSLYAVLPAEDLQAVRTVLQDATDAAPGTSNNLGGPADPQGPHTADQRRADALVAVVTGGEVASVRSRHGRRPRVQVTVALSTLLGVDDEPGELDGTARSPRSWRGGSRRMRPGRGGGW